MLDEKMAKFQELAGKRVNNALHAIELIGNLSNRSNYRYTDKHVEKIFGALESKIAEAKSKFVVAAPQADSTFSFDDMDAEASSGEDSTQL